MTRKFFVRSGESPETKIQKQLDFVQNLPSSFMSPRVQAINQTVRASIRESVRSMQQGIKIIC